MAPKKNVATSSNKKKATPFLPASTTLPNYTGPETRQRTQVLASMLQNNPGSEDRHHNLDSSPDSLAAWESRSPTPGPNDMKLGGSPISPTASQQQSSASSKGLSMEDPMEPSTPVFQRGSPDTNVAVMTTNATTPDERVANLESRLALLEKALQEKDKEIAALKGKAQVQLDPKTSEEQPYPPGFAPHATTANTSMAEQPRPEATGSLPSTSAASLSVQQLQDMIVDTIRLQQREPQRAWRAYAKPYTRRIELLEMPSGYQPPKFHQFDGRGDPRQHIAHFVETCDSAGTRGDMLVKQFVRSLKDKAFD